MEHLHPQSAHMVHALIAHTAAEFFAGNKQTTAVKNKTKPKKKH